MARLSGKCEESVERFTAGTRASARQVVQPRLRGAVAASTAPTIALIPAFTCKGMRLHAATSHSRSLSGSPAHGTAVVSAVASDSHAVSSCSAPVSEMGPPFPKPGVAGSSPAGRTKRSSRVRRMLRRLALEVPGGLRVASATLVPRSWSAPVHSSPGPGQRHFRRRRCKCACDANLSASVRFCPPRALLALSRS